MISSGHNGDRSHITLLRNYDRNDMSYGAERRMPFLEHHLVSLAFSLSRYATARNGFSKAAVCDTIAPFMPRETARRKTKIDFNLLIVDWMRGPLRGFMFDAITNRSFRECSLIYSKKVVDAARKAVRRERKEFLIGQDARTMISLDLCKQAIFHDHMVAA